MLELTPETPSHEDAARALLKRGANATHTPGMRLLALAQVHATLALLDAIRAGAEPLVMVPPTPEPEPAPEAAPAPAPEAEKPARAPRARKAAAPKAVAEEPAK